MIMKVFVIEWVNSNKEQSRAKFYEVPLITNFKNNSIAKLQNIPDLIWQWSENLHLS